MNKYVLMLAAAGLIAAAPAYYAFQAQAEEAAPATTEAATPAATTEAGAPATESTGAAAATDATGEVTPEAKEAASKESAAGEPAKAAPAPSTNE